MNKLFLYMKTVNDLEEIVQDLSSSFPVPKRVPFSDIDGFIYRHDSSDRTNILASFLKAVRIISLLNASMCLLKEGYAQEVYILCRAIHEANEDIQLLGINDEEALKTQKEFLSAFYREELNMNSASLNFSSDNMIQRKKIHSTINAFHQRNKISDKNSYNPSRNIYQMYSGYVHGSYDFIIEMYEGNSTKYNTTGKSFLINLCINNFFDEIYRSIVIIQSICNSVNRPELLTRSFNLAMEFLKNSEGNEKLIEGLQESMKKIQDKQQQPDEKKLDNFSQTT